MFTRLTESRNGNETPCPVNLKRVTSIQAHQLPIVGEFIIGKTKKPPVGSRLNLQGGGFIVVVESPDKIMELDGASGAVVALISWLKASLNCKTHVWEPDQRQAAEETIALVEKL